MHLQVPYNVLVPSNVLLLFFLLAIAAVVSRLGTVVTDSSEVVSVSAVVSRLSTVVNDSSEVVTLSAVVSRLGDVVNDASVVVTVMPVHSRPLSALHRTLELQDSLKDAA